MKFANIFEIQMSTLKYFIKLSPQTSISDWFDLYKTKSKITKTNTQPLETVFRLHSDNALFPTLPW